MNNCNKPPVNMRRALRMMDGGEIHADVGGVWESLKRTVSGRPAETLSEQYARKDAARAASRPAPIAAPAAAPPAQTAAPMGSQSVLDRRMAAAGLRNGGDLRTGHGGVVPGTGTGDKIPAKYEPGEFVVSNDMLDAQPELRGHLRSLRESVLAEKGMTPEQADAKALSGTGLRAQEGIAPYVNHVFGDNAAKMANPNTSLVTTGQPGTNGYKPNFTMGGTPPPSGAAIDVPSRVVPEGVPKYTPPPVDPTTGRYANGPQNSGAGVSGSGSAGNANLAGGAGRAAQAGVSLEPTASGLLRERLLGSTDAWRKVGGALNKPRSVPGAGAVGKVLKVAAAPVSAYQTYQDVKAGNYGDAAIHGADAAAGAALFSPAAPAAGAYLGARGAYEAPQMLRDQLGESGLDVLGGVINQVGLRSGLWGVDDSVYLANKAGYSPAPAPKPRAPGPTDMPAISGSFGGTNSVSPAPSPAPSLRTQSFAAGTPEAIAAGKQMDSGSKYIPSYGKGMIRNSRGDIIQLDTSGDAPSDGRVRTQLLPSSYRSLSESPSAPSLLNARPQAGSFIEEVRNNVRRRQGDRSRGLDIQEDANIRGDRATLRGQDVAVRGQDITARGQDLTYGSSLYGHDLSANTARAQALRDQFNKDRDYMRGVSNDAFSQREEADKGLTSKLESMFTTKDDKGNTVPDRDLVASHKAGITSYIGNALASLEKVPPTSPDYAQSQRAAAALREKGAAGLGEDRLQKLIAQLEVQRRSADASSGINPLKGRHVDSSNPEDYAITGVEPGVLQDQYILKGGGRVPTRVLDYDKGGNAILPNFIGNSPTRRFDIIKQKGLRNE